MILLIKIINQNEYSILHDMILLIKMNIAFKNFSNQNHYSKINK